MRDAQMDVAVSDRGAPVGAGRLGGVISDREWFETGESGYTCAHEL